MIICGESAEKHIRIKCTHAASYKINIKKPIAS